MQVTVNSEDWVESGASDAARVVFQGTKDGTFMWSHQAVKPKHDVRGIIIQGDTEITIQTRASWKLWLKAVGSGEHVVCGVEEL